MDNLVQMLMPTDLPPTLGGGEYVLLALLVAFCIGHIIAWTYMLTHTGLSYSQMFCASLLVLPVLVGDIRAVIVGQELETLEVRLFRFLLAFARDNELQLERIANALASPDALSPPALATRGGKEPREPV